MTEERIESKEIKKISIVEYLQKRGMTVNRIGNKHVCSSPFSSDSDPSFYIYPTNTFYDFSSGTGGDIIRLVEQMEQCTFEEALQHLTGGSYEAITQITKEAMEQEQPAYNFVLAKYRNKEPNQIAAITRYAHSRCLTEGWEPGVYFTHGKGKEWKPVPAVMFVHVTDEGEVCGARFRNIYPNTPKRFSSRGRLCYYILENPAGGRIDRLFLVESESSANSLWMHAKAIGLSCAIVSFGGVANIQQRLPSCYDAVQDRRLFIDYDGKEAEYEKRLMLYGHLDVKPVKLPLPKGEDFNSLYCTGNIHLINKFIY